MATVPTQNPGGTFRRNLRTEKDARDMWGGEPPNSRTSDRGDLTRTKTHRGEPHDADTPGAHTHLLLREGRVMGVTETALPFGCITASALNSTKHVFTPNFRTHRKEDFRRASNSSHNGEERAEGGHLPSPVFRLYQGMTIGLHLRTVRQTHCVWNGKGEATGPGTELGASLPPYAIL